MEHTNPAVAMPVGFSFLALMERIIPITPQISPKTAPYAPKKINTIDTIPRTNPAIAFPFDDCSFIILPTFYTFKLNTYVGSSLKISAYTFSFKPVSPAGSSKHNLPDTFPPEAKSPEFNSFSKSTTKVVDSS